MVDTADMARVGASVSESRGKSKVRKPPLASASDNFGGNSKQLKLPPDELLQRLASGKRKEPQSEEEKKKEVRYLWLILE